ncbi:Small RNA-binding protein 11, chloroplastic [Linum grandiflorum]
MAAAIRRIASRNFVVKSSSSLLLPPALIISCRSIATKLFVGGLSFCTTEDGLSESFSQYGQVVEAKVITDRVSNKSKGFGFVTFASANEAGKAVTEMDGKSLNGRVIFVDYAKAKASSGGGGIPIARGPPEGLQTSNTTELITSETVTM